MTTFTIHSFNGEFVCVNNTTQEKTFSVNNPTLKSEILLNLVDQP